MKRIFALVLAITLAFSLIGCTPKVKVDNKNDTNPENENTVQDTHTEVSNIPPLVDVSYPEMSPYPNEQLDDWQEYDKQYNAWKEDRNTQRNFVGRGEGVDSFVCASVKEILAGNTTDNLVYSPMNVYIALGMLAEIAYGDSRTQILDLLGEASIEDVRTSAKGVWNNNYCNDGALVSVLAGSVWADESVAIKEDTAKALAENYYAEVYSCDVGSSEMLQAYKAWLNEQTGGLLKDSVDATQIDPETILALATTVYFRAKWDGEFNQSANTVQVFNTANGTVDSEFMHQSGSGTYYYSDNFAAVQKRFHDGGSMWFILPDEDVTVNQLTSDEAALDLILNNGGSCDNTHVIINMSVPKFDVKSDIDLKQDLINLGVTDVFGGETANFGNLATSADDIWLDKVKHVARVAIDEEGVTAAAYTEMMLMGAGLPPEEEVDFVLDRPFMFAITGVTGDVLFIGIVNNPVA